MNVRIQIGLTEADSQTEMHPIDDAEQAVVALNKEAIHTAIQHHGEQWSQDVFTKQDFTSTGCSVETAKFYGLSGGSRPASSRQSVKDAVTAYHHERRADFPIAVPEAQAFYEDPARTVNVSIDDVGVVKQVPKRRRQGAASAQKTKPARHDVLKYHGPRGYRRRP